MRSDTFYRAFFWFQLTAVTVELWVGLWLVAGLQTAVAAIVKGLGRDE